MKQKSTLTKHAKVRFEERSSYNKTEQQNNADHALNRGYDCCCFKDPLFTFLRDRINCTLNGAKVAKVYNDYVYIFSNIGHKLITVYKLPEEYLPADQYLIPQTDLESCLIFLENKKTGKIVYWGESGITEDIAEAIEFKTQIKANRYLLNNVTLGKLSVEYHITVF